MCSLFMNQTSHLCISRQHESTLGSLCLVSSLSIFLAKARWEQQSLGKGLVVKAMEQLLAVQFLPFVLSHWHSALFTPGSLWGLVCSSQWRWLLMRLRSFLHLLQNGKATEYETHWTSFSQTCSFFFLSPPLLLVLFLTLLLFYFVWL